MNRKYNLLINKQYTNFYRQREDLTCMETHLQPSYNPNILRSEDISQIIKHFSFTIQQRIEQIQTNSNQSTSSYYEKSQVQEKILSKYKQYRTSNEQQVKLLEKFTERIMQIFWFFRQKSQQPQILQRMAQKIGEKLKQIMRNQVNYQFFVNNRPQVQKTAVRPLMNKSGDNDMFLVVGPVFTKAQIDVNAIFINNKKIKTQTKEKKVVEVGKLFKYVFSVLKGGYLMKLRMQRHDKGPKNNQKNKRNKLHQNSTISVQGTGAILSTLSQKSKQNLQDHRLLCNGKQKLMLQIQNTEIGFQLSGSIKKQNCIFRNLKNSSISTHQYSFLSVQNPLILKQPSTKIRQLEKRLMSLYDILDIQKHCITRIAKDPVMWKKDHVKRNSGVEYERKRYIQEYRKYGLKQKKQSLYKGDKNMIEVQQIEETQININSQQACQDQEKLINNFKYSDKEQNKQSQFNTNKEGDQFQTLRNTEDLQIKLMARTIVDNVKTQQNECCGGFASAQKQNRSNFHTLIVCSSRFHQKQSRSLAYKMQNLMDRSVNGLNLKSSSMKQSRKALRLNLPSMLMQKSNILNREQSILQPLNISRNPQKPLKISQKSQAYIQNYHNNQSDDSNSFVPLLPLRQKMIHNQNSKNQFSVKKRNKMPSFHPLNRCRIFRQKKNQGNVRGMMQIAVGRFADDDFDDKFFNGKIKNAIF